MFFRYNSRFYFFYFFIFLRKLGFELILYYSGFSEMDHGANPIISTKLELFTILSQVELQCETCSTEVEI